MDIQNTHDSSVDLNVTNNTPIQTNDDSQQNVQSKTSLCDDVIKHEDMTDNDDGNEHKQEVKVIRGSNVSGRAWKQARSKKTITHKVKQAALTWEEKMEMKKQRLAMKALDDEIRQRKQEEEDLRKEKKKQAIIRKKQNVAKNAVVQQVTNKKKLRHMSSKQFKQLRQFHFDEIE
ncbi:Coiled-coil domain-containing protein 86 [Entamoeba marina]